MGTHERTRLPAADAKIFWRSSRLHQGAPGREFSFPALKPVVEVAIRMAGLLLPFERGYW
jgi:hypothetical protein